MITVTLSRTSMQKYRSSRYSYVGRFVGVFLLLCSSAVLSQEPRTQVGDIKRILIVNEVGALYPSIDQINRGIRTELESAPYKIEFYSEYLETVLFPDPTTQQEFRAFILRKYQNLRPDLIVAIGPSALRFMEETHKTAFKGVPLVFCYFLGRMPGGEVPDSDFTGVESDVAVTPTVEAALRLQPQTEHIFVVGGQGNFDKQLQAPIRNQLKAFEKRLDIVYLTALAMPELLEHLRHLPSRSAILFTTLAEDAAGNHFKSNESGPLIIAAANAPVFSLFDLYLNHGEVGGNLFNTSEQGRIAGKLAVRILNGEKPQDIPRVTNVTGYMFDLKALHRWGFKESNLPPGSVVINRQPSFWELYRRYGIVATVALVTQMGVIFGLLWQRRRKLRAEAALRRSEEKFSKTFRQSPLVVAITRTSDSRYIDINDASEEQFGWARDEVVGRTPEDLALWADADQRAAFKKRLQSEGSVRDLEVSLRRRNGQIRTALVSAELIEISGEPCTVSVAADITERKRAEEVLSSVSRRLIQAQEEERARIARELHDDINQRLALLAVKLGNLRNEVPALDVLRKQHIDEISKEVGDLGLDVQALSHQLHSSKLEYLGLAVAARGFCREFSERHNVEVQFHSDNIPETLPTEISLSLFRVLQEALQNALKYSGTKRFEARLEGTPSEIHLRVRDSGVGFDPESAMHLHGLGLISMTERLKLVDGQLSIDSKPQCGTTIHASVPLKSAVQSEVKARTVTA